MDLFSDKVKGNNDLNLTVCCTGFTVGCFVEVKLQ